MFKRSMGVAVAMLIMAGVMVGGCGSSGSSAGSDSPRIGVIQPVEHPALDASVKGFVDGLAERGYKEGQNITIDRQNAQGDHANMESIANRFVADNDKLVFAVATSAAQVMANKTKDIPIVGAAIFDYKKADLIKDMKAPGTNVTGVTNFNPLEKQVDLILKVMPSVKEIGVVYASSEVNSQAQIEAFKAYAAKKGLNVTEGTITSVNDIQQVAQNLVNQGVKAIFVPTDNLVASAMPNLTAVTDAAKVPVFIADDNLLSGGGLMGYTVDYYKLGVQAGHMAADILDGKKKPQDMPIQMQDMMKLAINNSQLTKLGITVPSDVPKEAK